MLPDNNGGGPQRVLKREQLMLPDSNGGGPRKALRREQLHRLQQDAARHQQRWRASEGPEERAARKDNLAIELTCNSH